jgi:hypothetical protein
LFPANSLGAARVQGKRKGDKKETGRQLRDRAKPQAEKAQADKVPIGRSKKAKEFGKTSHTG